MTRRTVIYADSEIADPSQTALGISPAGSDARKRLKLPKPLELKLKEELF
jgi:hypothetical protein